MITFPEGFRFGVSTSAAQIETAENHNWKGLRALDGSVFSKTTEHEKRWKSDVDILSDLAPNYRMSLLWSKLQHQPFAELNHDGVTFYLSLINELRKKGVSIMLVLHHFEEPTWFYDSGSWAGNQSFYYWIDYVSKIVDVFGPHVHWWNTFNEPNLLISMGFLIGKFPPGITNPVKAYKALVNISKSHHRAYSLIKEKFPQTLVGLSHNSVLLESENIFGLLPAKVTDWWYMDFIPSWYGHCDFFGMSYYARVGYDPYPITYLFHPKKFSSSKRLHDQLWEYHPEGLSKIMKRYWERFGKPILITENGVSTNDDKFRRRAIFEYLSQVREAMDAGVPCLGYFHWTAWDNFEWNLGSSYHFGLCEVDSRTMERIPRESARYYSKLAHSRVVTSPDFQHVT